MNGNGFSRVRGRGYARALLAGLALLATACGGSGGGSPTAPEAGPETAVEYLSFDLANRARHEEGVDPQLVFDPGLADIARAHSEAMRDQGFFAHLDPEGHDAAFRLQTAGAVFVAVGENLALVDDVSDPAAVAHRGFLNNPPHRANLLDPRFTHGGVGVARRGGTYWITQIFVRR